MPRENSGMDEFGKGHAKKDKDEDEDDDVNVTDRNKEDEEILRNKRIDMFNYGPGGFNDIPLVPGRFRNVWASEGPEREV